MTDAEKKYFEGMSKDEIENEKNLGFFSDYGMENGGGIVLIDQSTGEHYQYINGKRVPADR